LGVFISGELCENRNNFFDDVDLLKECHDVVDLFAGGNSNLVKG